MSLLQPEGDAHKAAGSLSRFCAERAGNLRLDHAVGEVQTIDGGQLLDVSDSPWGAVRMSRRRVSSDMVRRTPFLPCSTAASALTL